MMGRRNFKGQVVVITGAGGGLGKAMARRFGQAGSKVVGVDLRKEPLGQTEEEFRADNLSFTGYVGDVTDLEGVRELAERIKEEVGPAQVLINNAGISHLSKFKDTELKVIRQVMEINFFGSINWTKALLDQILDNRGLIIAISSVAGIAPLIGRTGYAASKHALHGFFESLRTEIEPEGARVMMVCPSFIATRINEHALGSEGGKAQKNRQHVGKKMTADEAAEIIYKGASREKDLLTVGRVAWLSRWLQKLWPRQFSRMMVKNFRDELED